MSRMNISIHPTSKKQAKEMKKKSCLRDLDGAFRWSCRLDGRTQGGNVKSEKENFNVHS